MPVKEDFDQEMNHRTRYGGGGSSAVSTTNAGQRRCLNCGSAGHVYRQCPHPLISHGIILFRTLPEVGEVQYLMICRRHTFGYVEFIRANFEPHNLEYVRQLITEMTETERVNLMTKPYPQLWHDLWMIKRDPNDMRHQREYERSGEQCERLLATPLIRSVLRSYAPHIPWQEPEWGFPKGKRNKHETGLECAKREMMEETNIRTHIIKIVPEFDMVSECFRGSDSLVYQHNYYVARAAGDAAHAWVDESNLLQAREVSDAQWLTYDECMERIRPYNTSKKELLTRVHKNICAYLVKQEELFQKFGMRAFASSRGHRYSTHVNTSKQRMAHILDYIQEPGEIAARNAAQIATWAALAAGDAVSAAMRAVGVARMATEAEEEGEGA